MSRVYLAKDLIKKTPAAGVKIITDPTTFMQLFD
jgi:hypothetical protein